ncbi:probable dolichyl pyrophosphate Glc1Man9GlcNAc2 alpha-1,3-glucosyltransferase [Drosophila subobscura]|uniref:probable dolichyl pyrophosphate Glc1Man9GlcNAc2 alpha-1,3-glucosyltransferase n=1 Tax=Drosophila subobscura TaxID=7241 RepID=UPI00155B1B53|nr:probable dolichyl pyrophosphate Glc1Man9GlcNAc2 alpha-1,3-glucosyltransferase [Drosophila subobscura]
MNQPNPMILNKDCFWQLVGISTGLKILLIPANHSTDFEVHRNWLAITHNLPLNRWYLDETSEWTLDYPPFFAYFEWLLSQVAKHIDPRMLIVENLNYESKATLYFQRLSVTAMDLIYVLGVRSCMSALGVVRGSQQFFAGNLLLLLNVGLIFIDHIHFQYNGFMFGILLLSISALLRQRYLWSAFTFAVLLNFKHIFLYLAPPFGVYLLRFYCLEQASAKGGSFWRCLLKLLAVGLSPFVVSFGPFWRQLPQLMSRLFPFKRGLTHAYWAPNIWALYNTADKMAAKLLQTGPSAGPTTTSGLVQQIEHEVLPTITPSMTFGLTIAFMLPILLKLFKSSKKQSPSMFLRAVVLCACSSFMFGWHVHEKAILMVLIPLCLLTLVNREDARHAYVLSTAAYFSLFPLLYDVDLYVPRYSLYLSYIAMLYGQLYRMFAGFKGFHWLEWTYMLGFTAIPLYEHVLSPLLGLDKRLPFMPLLLTSTYAALGVVYFFGRYYMYAMGRNWWPQVAASKATATYSSSAKRKRKTK